MSRCCYSPKTPLRLSSSSSYSILFLPSSFTLLFLLCDVANQRLFQQTHRYHLQKHNNHQYLTLPRTRILHPPTTNNINVNHNNYAWTSQPPHRPSLPLPRPFYPRLLRERTSLRLSLLLRDGQDGRGVFRGLLRVGGGTRGGMLGGTRMMLGGTRTMRGRR